MTKLRLVLPLGLIPLALGFLSGCAGHAAIEGRVVEGKVSYVGLVDPNDSRLKGEGGVAGAAISARTVVENQGGRNLDQATSDAKGNFHLNVKEQSAFARPTQFNVTKEGYITADGAVPFPPSDRRVLIILKPAPGASPAR
jgi:hypothetical protein